MPTTTKERTSKQAWLAKGLEVLRDEGVQRVRIERMALALGVAKSGFYWHFADRDDLLQQMLDYWSKEYTEVVSRDEELLRAPPRDRLRRTMELILDRDLTAMDLSIRAWAAQDDVVARRVRQVYATRLDFVRRALTEFRFEGDDLEMRTRLFVTYQSWERTMFWKEPKAKLRRLIERRIDLLLSR